MKFNSNIILLLLVASITSLSFGLNYENVSDGENLQKPDTTKNDSTEYKLIVFDSGFETWYLQRNKPSWYHTESYYEHWNQRYVNEWNYRYALGDARFDSHIEYRPSKDYGIELEHKLYYYFKYFQEKNNVSLK